MKVYSIEDLKPGMITAAPVKTQRGQLIIQADVELTPALISRIDFYGVQSVQIQEETLAEAPPIMEEKKPAPAIEPSYSKKVKNSEEFHKYQKAFTTHTNDLKKAFQAVGDNGNAINKEELLQQTASLINSQHTTLEFFDILHNMRQDNDSVYAHCLNVALISRMIGIWLKFSQEDLDTLTLAGLLHDIGKTKIPNEILNKKERLTINEFSIIKQHTQFGYDILKSQNLNSHIKKVALMHHERCDGSGYPMGLTMDEIDDFALIVAIADVYDAMTAARSYRDPLCPFEVIEMFERDGLQKYKPKYILTFLEHIASSYQNNRVVLSDGREAKIVLLNSQHLSKPLVQLDNGECLDLHKAHISIKSIV